MLSFFMHSPPWPILILISVIISTVVTCARSWMTEVHAENSDFQVIVGQAPSSAEAREIQTDKSLREKRDENCWAPRNLDCFFQMSLEYLSARGRGSLLQGGCTCRLLALAHVDLPVAALHTQTLHWSPKSMSKIDQAALSLDIPSIPSLPRGRYWA